MRHPLQDDLLEFAAGILDPGRAETLYAHLGHCTPCTDRVTTIRAIRADFEGSWAAFMEEYALRASLAGAAPSPAADLALRVRGILDGGKRLAAAAVERLTGATGGLDAAFVPAYSGVGDPERSQEAARLAEEASRHCGAGDLQAAVRALEAASRVDPEAGASVTLNVLRDGNVVGKVVVHAGRRALSVLVDPTLAGFRTGRVVLETEALEPRSVMLEPVEGAAYLLAEFEDVPDGAFSVGLEMTR